MGLFGSSKKKKDNNTANVAASPKRSKKKYHSRRKKSNLISDMKISGSVPTAIIDAIRGDKSIISSDQDFVRAQKVSLNGQTYYPVFVMDEDTFEDCGIDSPENRKTYGQLSNGLKTSSGATGLLPILTEQSSSDNYFAILPMNDAFEFLDSKPVFADYAKGWPVGLLNVDNDTLTLQKTSLRLNMSQWMDFIKGNANFSVVDGRLKFDSDIPETSDPLALSSDEQGTDNQSVSNTDPLDEFDDNNDASNSSNNVSGADEFDKPDVNTGNTDQNQGAPENGYSLDDIPLDDDESDAVPVDDNATDNTVPNDSVNDEAPEQVVMQPSQSNQVNNQNDVNVDQNNQGLNGVNQQSNQPVQQSGQQLPVNNNFNDQSNVNQNSVNNVNNAQVNSQPVVSRDELDADTATLSASVQTLNDLKIAISDQEFINAYLNPLKMTPIPLADDSNDPTGRIHHINDLRRQANLELESAEQTVKARLRQWFETQRAGELDALKDGVRDDGPLVQGQMSLIERLKNNLNDNSGLKAVAQLDIQDELNRLTHSFEEAKKHARQAALVEVEDRFNQRQVELDQRKDDMVVQQIAVRKQAINREIADVKSKIQQVAQAAASKGYRSIMEQGSLEYKRAQQALDQLHSRLMHQLSNYEKQSREDENRRVDAQADIARNDTTIANLKSQLEQVSREHQSDLSKREQEYKRELDKVRNQAVIDRKNEFSQMQRDIAEAQKQRDEANARLDKQQDVYNKMLNEHDAKNLSQVEGLESSLKEAAFKNEQTLKRGKFFVLVALSIAAFLMILVSFVFYSYGKLSTYEGQSSRTNQSGTPVYQYTPQYVVPNASSSSTSSSTESSTSSSSSNESSSSSSHHNDSSSDKDSSSKSSK